MQPPSGAKECHVRKSRLNKSILTSKRAIFLRNGLQNRRSTINYVQLIGLRAHMQGVFPFSTWDTLLLSFLGLVGKNNKSIPSPEVCFLLLTSPHRLRNSPPLIKYRLEQKWVSYSNWISLHGAKHSSLTRDSEQISPGSNSSPSSRIHFFSR